MPYINWLTDLLKCVQPYKIEDFKTTYNRMHSGGGGKITLEDTLITLFPMELNLFPYQSSLNTNIKLPKALKYAAFISYDTTFDA